MLLETAAPKLPLFDGLTTIRAALWRERPTHVLGKGLAAFVAQPATYLASRADPKP